jgi:hypothetical protein
MDKYPATRDGPTLKGGGSLATPNVLKSFEKKIKKKKNYTGRPLQIFPKKPPKKISPLKFSHQKFSPLKINFFS